jgi:tRNA-binding protein
VGFRRERDLQLLVLAPPGAAGGFSIGHARNLRHRDAPPIAERHLVRIFGQPVGPVFAAHALGRGRVAIGLVGLAIDACFLYHGAETVEARYVSLMTISYDQFAAVDIRVGSIVSAEPFPEARKPAFKLLIDFGPEIGRKTSSAQITAHYTPETLTGHQVAAVVNFAPRQIGPFMSEVLTLGFPDADGEVVLITPTRDVPDGGRLF